MVGQSTCDLIAEAESFGDLLEVGMDTGYVYARNANASRDDARDLVLLSVEHLCPSYQGSAWGGRGVDALEDCLSSSPQPVPPYCPVQYTGG